MNLRDIPRPRTVLGWTTVVMVCWLAVVFVGSAVSGQNPIFNTVGWGCLFAPILLVMALVDRAVSDRRGARSVHQQGGAWQVPEYMPEDVQHAPLPQQPMYPQQPQQPTYPSQPDHNPWA